MPHAVENIVPVIAGLAVVGDGIVDAARGSTSRYALPKRMPAPHWLSVTLLAIATALWAVVAISTPNGPVRVAACICTAAVGAVLVHRIHKPTTPPRPAADAPE